MDDQYVKPRRRRSGGIGRLIFNLLTLVIVVGTLALIAAFVAIFLNPYQSFNPFPPPTLPPPAGTPTATNTPALPLPTPWTPTATTTPAPTTTLTPTLTETPEDTPTPTPQSPPFALQPGNPVRIPNIANAAGCDWMGVGGQVFSLENDPILEIGVHLGGELQGEPIDLDALTGSATDIGPSGYVFDLADHPIGSDGSIWIQLNDGSGTPLSDQVNVSTSNNCSENFVMVNWRQVREP